MVVFRTQRKVHVFYLVLGVPGYYTYSLDMYTAFTVVKLDMPNYQLFRGSTYMYVRFIPTYYLLPIYYIHTLLIPGVDKIGIIH